MNHDMLNEGMQPEDCENYIVVCDGCLRKYGVEDPAIYEQARPGVEMVCPACGACSFHANDPLYAVRFGWIDHPKIKEGISARRSRKPVIENPYLLESKAGQLWTAGWQYADTAFREAHHNTP